MKLIHTDFDTVYTVKYIVCTMGWNNFGSGVYYCEFYSNYFYDIHSIKRNG